MDYIPQKARDLRFALFEQEMPGGLVKVVKSISLRAGELLVQASIIGASHFFTATSSDGARLTEVLACLLLPTNIKPLCSGSIDLDVKQVLVLSGRYTYSIRIRQENLQGWSAEQLPLDNFEVPDGSYQTSTQAGIHCFFPNGGRASPAPLTSLQMAYTKGVVGVRTAHTYPEEGLVVLTESAIVRRN